MAIRLALTSDLHVDHHPQVLELVGERVRALQADVLIVAGDVSGVLETIERSLEVLRAAAPRAVYVPGNHDLWCTAEGPSSRERYERLLPEAARRAGFEALGAGPVEIEGVAFVGVTGWYDFSMRSRALDSVYSLEDYRRGAGGKLRWNDVLRVRWPDERGQALEASEICDRQVAELERQLRLVEGGPTVVVTHHLPFAELVTERGDVTWDFLNAFMGSARLGEAIRRSPSVRLACCGHTHFRKRAVIEGAGGPIRVEASPVGYPREYLRLGLGLAERIADRVLAIEL